MVLEIGLNISKYFIVFVLKPKESSEEDDDDDDDDEIIEDEFVRIKKNLFGKEGTRQASVHWFKATQSMAARDPSGVFAKWFHGIITRR